MYANVFVAVAVVVVLADEAEMTCAGVFVVESATFASDLDAEIEAEADMALSPDNPGNLPDRVLGSSHGLRDLCKDLHVLGTALRVRDSTDRKGNREKVVEDTRNVLKRNHFLCLTN